MEITVKVHGRSITFDIDESGELGELIFYGNEEQYVKICDEVYTTSEDFILPIIEYMKKVNNIDLNFAGFGNLDSRLLFHIDLYKLIQTFK